MAAEAGVYEVIWRPAEAGVHAADDVRDKLRAALVLLKREPERFRKLEPANGWGTVEGFIDFVDEYLRACEENPDAEVTVSR
jgi:hypothetical protein